MADRILSLCDISVSAEMLPIHTELFPIRARSVPHPRLLEGKRSNDLAAAALSAVLPRRMGSCSAAQKRKKSNNRVTIYEI